MIRVSHLFRRVLPTAAFLLGLSVVTFALAAGLLGVDRGDDWGPTRRLTLALGLALTVLGGLRFVAAARHVLAARLAPVAAALRAKAMGWPASRAAASLWGVGQAWVESPKARLGQRLHSMRALEWIGQPRRWVVVAGLSIIALAIPVYLWIATVGFLDPWPASTSYYDRLADAFRSGRTSLLEGPDERLRALPNPYDFDQRQGIPVLWDAVYYRGEYFLYWGPAPAVVLALLKSIGVAGAGDEWIVILGVAGTALFTILALAALWLNVVPRLPRWTFVPPLIVAAFVNPLPWLLNRPSVYEAAIGAGQLFLMAGISLVAIAAIRPPRRPWVLGLAGLCLACAVGSKASLAPAAVWWVIVGIVVAVARAKRGAQARFRRRQLGALLLPFLAGVAFLGWYNASRFGSPLEFGFRYQLTWTDQNTPGVPVLSPANLPMNAFNYLVGAVRTLSVFPFLKPDWALRSAPWLRWGTYTLPGLRIHAPPTYFQEQVAGLVYTFPFAGFALAAWAVAYRSLRNRDSQRNPNIEAWRAPPFYAYAIALSGGVAAAAIPILLLFAASMRYLADFVPTLVLLASLGAWGLYASRRAEGKSTQLLAWVIWAAAIATVVVGLLLAVTGYAMRFEQLNPELFDRITRWFAW
jgi:hypothetical protein